MYLLIFYLWHSTGNKKGSDIYHGIIAEQEQRVHCRLQIDEWGKGEKQMCITHTIDRAKMQTFSAKT